MTNYRRYRVNGGCYFFTVALAERSRRLLTEHIQILRTAFREVKAARPFMIEAIVVLPDHLHGIWTLPESDDDFSLRWREIKAAFSRQLPKTERRSKSRVKKGEQGIWQRRFWEHAIRDEVDCQRHVDCINYFTLLAICWVEICLGSNPGISETCSMTLRSGANARMRSIAHQESFSTDN